MCDSTTLLDHHTSEPTEGGTSLPDRRVPFARAYAQALLALRGAKLSRFGRAAISVTEDVAAGRAQLRVRRYPTLPWEACGPDVGIDLASALSLAAEDMRATWSRT